MGKSCNFDQTRIIYFNSRIGFALNRSDDFSAGADNFTDLVGINTYSNYFGRIGRDLIAGFFNGLYHLVKDKKPADTSLFKSLFHDICGKLMNLDIHLERCYAVSCACNLEIHVASVIFIPKDVRQDNNTISFLYKPHRNTGNWSLNGNPSVHQRQDTRTYCSHG